MLTTAWVRAMERAYAYTSIKIYTKICNCKRFFGARAQVHQTKFTNSVFRKFANLNTTYANANANVSFAGNVHECGHVCVSVME